MGHLSIPRDVDAGFAGKHEKQVTLWFTCRSDVMLPPFFAKRICCRKQLIAGTVAVIENVSGPDSKSAVLFNTPSVSACVMTPQAFASSTLYCVCPMV